MEITKINQKVVFNLQPRVNVLIKVKYYKLL